MTVDDEEKLTPGVMLLIPPAETSRAVRLRAIEPSRVVRVVHGRAAAARWAGMPAAAEG